MSFIDWQDSYSVGIKSIDDQHKKIVELMNELVESIRDGREDFIIKEVLQDLSDYASYHFGLEEEVFLKFHYDVKSQHFERHRDFVEKIRSLQSEEDQEQRQLPLETLNYLRDWFQDHELNFDSDYGKYFRDNKLSDSVESMLQSGMKR